MHSLRNLSTLASGTLVLTILFGGCQQPTPRVQQELFIEKPMVCPPPARSHMEIVSCFEKRKEGDELSNRWKSLIANGPSCLQGIAKETLPLPGTPWYEYLRSGQDFTSKADKVICDEYQKARRTLETNDANTALRRLFAGSMALELGLLDEAKEHFLEAVWWMEEATDEDLETKAALGRSDIKIYKGDAYERAMVHFYLGVIAYKLGHFQEARREFSRAIQADYTKPSEDMRGKFALLHYWIGKTYARMGDISNAELAMTKGKASATLADQSLFDLNSIKNANLTVLIQAGSCPTKILKGADRQHSRYQKGQFDENGCDVFIDGKNVGQARLLADAWHQVSTSGVSEVEKLQSVKGTTKGVLQVMPYINLLAVAWDVRGDIRSWSVLPGQILVWNGTVPPGEHTITIKFYDKENYELRRHRQTWYYVPIEESGETILLVRSGKNKCNMNGKEI